MSDENKQRITWGVSLSGVVALLLLLASAWSWAAQVESRISVLESQYKTVISNQEYMIQRIDEMD